MKTAQKLVSKFSVLILMIAFCINCGKKTSAEHEEEKPTVEAPTNIISLKEADVIYNNYSKHRVAVIEPYETTERAPEEKFEASRFVDFDYETIKQYLDYVDQEAAKAGVKKVTKLRLYFANYPNEQQFPNDKKVVHPRQNSIFMVPTLEKGGINYGFYIGPNGKASLITDWKTSLEKGMGFLKEEEKAYAGFSMNTNLDGDGSLTLNFGHGGPPPKTDF